MNVLIVTVIAVVPKTVDNVVCVLLYNYDYGYDY